MTHRKSYTINDFYQFYLSNIERDTVYDIDYKVYRQIIEDYFKFIADQVIEHSREFKLPCRLGNLSIVKRRPKNFDNKSLRIDYHESAIQGKAVYFINEHSRYQFVATRANKRRLAQIIKNREHDYVEIK